MITHSKQQDEACLGINCFNSQFPHWAGLFQPDQNCFYPEYKQYTNLKEYDCISQYHPQPEDFELDVDDDDNDL
jgi:hypothetical protein